MATRKQDAEKLAKELEKAQMLRHDEQAWKRQMKKVNEATDAYRSHFRAGRPID